MQADWLHAEATAGDGVVRLRNTRMRQAASSYEVEGEYRLANLGSVLHEAVEEGLRRGGLAAERPAAVPAASKRDAGVHAGAAQQASVLRVEAAGRDADGDSAGSSKEAAAEASVAADADAALLAAADGAPSPARDATPDAPAAPQLERADSAVDGPAAAGKAEEPPQQASDSWWLRIRSDAELQDILPAVEALQRAGRRPTQRTAPAAAVESRGGLAATDAAPAPAEPVADIDAHVDFGSRELEMGYQQPDAAESFAADLQRELQDSTWCLGQAPLPRAAPAASEPDGAKMPALSSATGRFRSDVTALGGADGATQVKLNVQGGDWAWGPICVDRLKLVGTLDEAAGLHVQDLNVQVRACATLSIHLHLFDHSTAWCLGVTPALKCAGAPPRRSGCPLALACDRERQV